jgi:hypothetical protein
MIGVVWDDHELHIAWPSQNGVIGAAEPRHLEGEGFLLEVGWIPKSDVVAQFA